ncbi:Peptidyl-prolyl cis-trans isomerase cyp18 [Rubripirellula tenax]|uniref:Peptidyl-prolyl cis-trans isomerase n=1 Tax=Rubripirellula tenax TaxID=2528015 RepID=A0A5C6EIZ0_9BACT|nr:peptidylprolyl isomerase [Rubripirellula tenax]TWU47611.1 Peptidyl-prolyl cis-trans isomerase cyp18 [Rubripirellula tenax]
MLNRLSFCFAAALAVVSWIPNSAHAEDPILVEIDTSEGAIILELDKENAPLTVANFLEYIKKGHYAGTIFHRVIPDFMIQGGGMDASMKERDTLPPVRNEGANGLKNDEYTVAMARTGDPHSATSQFFINTGKNNGFLNRSDPRSDGYGYAVFGKVFDGKEVVDKIEAKQTRSVPVPGAGLMEDVPVEPITIKGVKVMSGAAE